MELTVTLSISPVSEESAIIETLESLPWDYEGIDLVVYSEDTSKVKRIIKEEDLESTLLNGQKETSLCKEPYSSDDIYKTIGVEDYKTKHVTSLKPGNTIKTFDPNILKENFEIGFGEDNNEKLPVAAMCFETRTLPVSDSGIIFSTEFLRKNNLSSDTSSIYKKELK